MGLSGFFSAHDSLMAGHGSTGSEFFSTTTFGMGAGSQAVPAVKRTSTSTRVINGKKVVTKKYARRTPNRSNVQLFAHLTFLICVLFISEWWRMASRR